MGKNSQPFKEDEIGIDRYLLSFRVKFPITISLGSLGGLILEGPNTYLKNEHQLKNLNSLTWS